MAYNIYRITKDKASKATNAVYQDNIVSRQSITIRDARVLGIEADERILLIEGSPEALTQADTILKELAVKEPEENSKKIYEKFKEEENVILSATSIFGE